jgi:thiol-disulfide isomerase/thioredoxin
MPKPPIALDARTFEEVALQQDGVAVLVDFWAAGCPPCEAMATIFAALADAARGRWGE